MATILARNLIDDALVILHDSGVRFPKSQLLEWLNAAQREVCIHRPDALTVNDSFTTAAQAKQSLPADGLRLIEVDHDETTLKPIHVVPRDDLDVHVIGWRSEEGDPEQYVYDLRDPKNFYLYPHPTDLRDISIVYAKSPTTIVIADFDTDVQTIELDDIYANAILDYLLYRAFSKDSDRRDPQKAGTHYNSMMQSLGVKTKVDSAMHPQATKG